MIVVLIHLKEQSQPIARENVLNVYTKGGLLCLKLSGKKTEKYPLESIFRIVEMEKE